MKNNMNEFEIRKEIIFCPICEEEHEVVLKKIKQKTKIKECEINSEIYTYECEKTHEKFENGELVELNLQTMRDDYRIKNNLLTKNEIVEIREKFKISQEDLSNILGLGDKTIARYETNTIQDKPYDILLRKFNEDYNFAYDMLMKAKHKFSSNKFIKIQNTIKGFISLNSEKIYNEMQLKNKYIFNDKESSANGFKLLDIEKLKSMIAYFARYTKNLFTVKLMKLLWYSDALSFEKTGHSMTGLIYTHMPRGALPIGYREICELGSVDKEYEEICDSIVFKLVPKKIDMFDDSLFSFEELSILQKVCEKFKDLSGTELSTIMHEEEIYKVTEEKEILDYTLIIFLKAF